MANLMFMTAIDDRGKMEKDHTFIILDRGNKGIVNTF